jgi:hypothetical protein
MIDKLSKQLFWISFVILIIVFAVQINNGISEHKQSQQAYAAENPEACEAIELFRYQAVCYSRFLDSGYSCATDACYFAYAVHIEDDWYCDKVFPTNVPLNLECRVSVFIERYTHEGLSDCCYME